VKWWKIAFCSPASPQRCSDERESVFTCSHYILTLPDGTRDVKGQVLLILILCPTLVSSEKFLSGVMKAKESEDQITLVTEAVGLPRSDMPSCRVKAQPYKDGDERLFGIVGEEGKVGSIQDYRRSMPSRGV
jgi:hypothetical protein